jgi:hypothetical protein
MRIFTPSLSNAITEAFDLCLGARLGCKGKEVIMKRERPAVSLPKSAVEQESTELCASDHKARPHAPRPSLAEQYAELKRLRLRLARTQGRGDA